MKKRFLILSILWFLASIFFVFFEDLVYPLSYIAGLCLIWAGAKLERLGRQVLAQEKSKVIR